VTGRTAPAALREATLRGDALFGYAGRAVPPGSGSAVRTFLSLLAALVAVGAPSLSRAAEESLSLVPDPLRLVLNFAALAVLIYPVHNLLLKPLVAVLEQRSARTTGALAQADRESTEARDLAGVLEQRLAAARREGQSQRLAALASAEAAERELLGRAREEAARTIETLRTRVQSETTAARSELPNLARGLAGDAAAKLLGRPL
jgi:F-type H+-transporting ATPase subunit b